MTEKPTQTTSHTLHELSLAALGVVFGDIGTSPLYALRECFHGEFGVEPDPASVLGVLSLMVWALIMIVSIKYLTFIFMADNRGEGGEIALTSLVRAAKFGSPRMKGFLVGIGLFAAALLYGDGMITPAISVLSAVEGLSTFASGLTPFVIPLTMIILIGVFLIQYHGTAHVGRLFGPIILVWFVVLAILGVIQIVDHPYILMAVFPWHGIRFLIHHELQGFFVLGAVFLVVTGAEALYADMGHFGRKPIRLVWVGLVLPALLLNYFGQGALLLASPELVSQPFYSMVPLWGRIPMVILATCATIIASQAVITGAFSLTRQAIQLGYLPRLRIIHTSARQIGQIYVPPVNWILMVCTLGLVLGFRESSRLAAAYGVAVTSTMLISSILFFVVARYIWHWNRWAAGIPSGIFLVIDLTFFAANLSKILHGAWFPLLIGAVIFTMMVTWRKGRELLGRQIRERVIGWTEFNRQMVQHPPQRVPGQAIFLTGNPETVPVALLHNLRHNRVLHEEIALLHFLTSEVPYVADENRIELIDMGSGICRIVAHYGYMEDPNIGETLSLARERGSRFGTSKASFFLGREKLSHGARNGLKFGPIRSRLFSFMSLFSLDAATYYEIPLDQVIEVGIQLQL